MAERRLPPRRGGANPTQSTRALLDPIGAFALNAVRGRFGAWLRRPTLRFHEFRSLPRFERFEFREGFLHVFAARELVEANRWQAGHDGILGYFLDHLMGGAAGRYHPAQKMTINRAIAPPTALQAAGLMSDFFIAVISLDSPPKTPSEGPRRLLILSPCIPWIDPASGFRHDGCRGPCVAPELRER